MAKADTMDNENLDLDKIESDVENKVQQRNRWEQLATAKVEAENKAKAETEARLQAEGKVQEAQRTAEFYKNFNAISSKYPQASQFQDQILERVNKGYDMEEAALGLLAKEGKLTSQPVQSNIRAEGGSSITVNEGPKEIRDMSQDERLHELMELEKSGELGQALRQGINIS